LNRALHRDVNSDLLEVVTDCDQELSGYDITISQEMMLFLTFCDQKNVDLTKVR
jgi:hypothetical protein